MTRSLLLLSVFFLVSCGGNPAPGGEGTNKLRHSAEENLVEISVLKVSDFRKELVANGKVFAKDKSSLGLKTTGIVNDIRVRNGDRVQGGDVIAVLDNTEALNKYYSALEGFEKSKLELNDAIIGFGYEAYDTLSVTDEVISISRMRSGYNIAKLALATAEYELGNCTIRAPFAGKVANLTKNNFEKIGEELCMVINDSRMVGEFHVFESELAVVRLGQEVRFVSFFDPSQQARGTIISINPSVDDKGRLLVQAEFNNMSGFVDGMNVKVYAETLISGQLVVPKSAVLIRDNHEVLFRYANGKAIWTYVNILNENSTSYVVEANTLRGADLNPGDTVILSGNLNLAHNSEVRPADTN